MKKNGFTLAEVLAVIILIALVSVVSVSVILNKINETKSDISDANKEIIFTAANFYIQDNALKFPKTEGNVYCIHLQSIIDDGYLQYPIISISGNEVDTSTFVQASYINKKFNLTYDVKNCQEIK